MDALEQMHALSEPTYCRLKHSKDPALLEKLEHLENILVFLKSSQKQQDKIMSEAKLLQIMIYRRRQQLRSEKSLQLVRRVQACMKRMSTFGRLFSLYDDIHKDLLSAVAEMKKNDVVYLPAQQTWSYLLYLQLQYVKLLDINCSYCITAFNHLSCHFATGMLIPQMVVFMGIVARIWLLSRSIAEKIKNCYSLVHSLRQHFDRTNSAWKEPLLPAHLQRSSPEDDCNDLQEMYNLASKAPASDSVEMTETASLAKVLKNTMLALDEEMEDIGVPVALTGTNQSASFDNSSSNKRKNSRENDFTPYKMRKHINDSSKQDNVAVISSKSSLSFTSPEMPAAKKRKKKLKNSSNLEVKQNSNVQNESVKSSAPEKSHNVESVLAHETSIVSDVRPKKRRKDRKKKIKAIYDGVVKLHTSEVGKMAPDSPNVTTKTGHETIKQEHKINKKDTEAKFQKRKKVKKSKLKTQQVC